MSDFYLLYQPKVKLGQIVALEALLRPKAAGISILDFIAQAGDTIALDLKILHQCLRDVVNYEINVPVSVNIHPSTLFNDDFIDEAIAAIGGRNIRLELIEYQQVNINSKLINNINKLKAVNIKISIDDFGKDFARADIALAIGADEVKFDRSLLKDIETNYIKFKHLAFLHSKIKSLCTDNIIFEGVETQKQSELIHIFAEKPTIQGFLFYKPMPLSEVIRQPNFNNTLHPWAKKDTTADTELNLDYILYNAIANDNISLSNQTAVNNFIRQKDKLGLVYNNDYKHTLKNLRSIYFKDSTVINNGVVSLIDATEKLVIIRNQQGVVIYDNRAHQQLMGASFVGVAIQDIIIKHPDYQQCLEKDQLLIHDKNAMFHIDEEELNNTSYQTIREKMIYNNETFVITNVCPLNKSLSNITKDQLTQCYTRSYLNYDLSYYTNSVLAFLDLNNLNKTNEKLGHHVGDNCLIDFCSIITSTLRKKDIFIRYGGDEFIILFDSTSIKSIDKKLRILNKEIQHHFSLQGISLSFSYGLSFIEDNIDNAIKSADQKMYFYKKYSRYLDEQLPTR